MCLKTKKWITTDEIDQQIREAYEMMYDPQKGPTALAKEIGWPLDAIYKRASELGVARTKEKAWTQKEIDLLERYAHLSLDRIVLKLGTQGFQRTRTAVSIKIKRMRFRKNHPYYTLENLAMAMGVDSHKISRWIRTGMLKAEPKGTERTPQQGGDTWLIHEKAIRDFFCTYPSEFDIRKVDQIWFLDIITQGKIGA